MGERLCRGNVAIALLANTLATGATLVTLILTVLFRWLVPSLPKDATAIVVAHSAEQRGKS